MALNLFPRCLLPVLAVLFYFWGCTANGQENPSPAQITEWRKGAEEGQERPSQGLVDPAVLLSKIDALYGQVATNSVHSDPDRLSRFAREMKDKASEMETKAKDLQDNASKIEKLARDLKNSADEKENKLQELQTADDQYERESLRNDLEFLNRDIQQNVTELQRLDSESDEFARARAIIAVALNSNPSIGVKSQNNDTPVKTPVEAVTEWETTIRMKDPAYPNMKDSIRAKIAEMISTEGMPTSADKAVEMTNKAYLEIKKKEISEKRN